MKHIFDLAMVFKFGRPACAPLQARDPALRGTGLCREAHWLRRLGFILLGAALLSSAGVRVAAQVVQVSAIFSFDALNSAGGNVDGHGPNVLVDGADG